MDENKIEHRNVQLTFFVTPKEKKYIRAKMSVAGIANQSAYLRKMAIDGYVVKIDMSDLKEVLRLLRMESNNLNQCAKVANESGYVNKKDIDDLLESHENLWDQMNAIIERLASIS